ncbi:olfactory receptor 2L3-like [Cavia porcellus]|uniref:olfactory receptor 2L3-like n=1 Tax=Cavia porcellus TaxID=10141 RepID=UPI000661C9CF|nr:olfactory receptor 2L3-like [Cavia porcellus]
MDLPKPTSEVDFVSLLWTWSVWSKSLWTFSSEPVPGLHTTSMSRWPGSLNFPNVHTDITAEEYRDEEKSYKVKVENYNLTSIDFILLGLFPPSRVGLVLLILIIPIFLIAQAGKLAMVLLILLDTYLHTPMYILLSQLSLMDLMYICTTVPKMASSFLSRNKCIFFIGCGVQAFFFVSLAGSEGLILTSMAYDRYVATCFPLHYPIHMNKRVCVLMTLGSWVRGAINSCAHTVSILRISYFRSRAINHFFCDGPAMLTLACGGTSVHEYTVFLSTVIFLLFPSMVILFSYGKIFLAVYCIRSQEGRKKAYFTCSSYLIVVTFYIVPFAYNYLCPKSLHLPSEDKVVAIFYTISTPMINPMFYSLRNKEVLRALGRAREMLRSMKL